MENENKEMEDDSKEMVNNGLYYIQDCLMNVSKIRIGDWDFITPKFPTEFLLEDKVNNETWEMSVGMMDKGELRWWCNTQHEDANLRLGTTFSFKKKEIARRVQREKIALWIMEETFRDDFGKEQLDTFLHNECIYKDAHNFILYG